MASFAQIDDTNTVVQVVSGVPVDGVNDVAGQDYINNTLGLPGTWLQCDDYPLAKLGVTFGFKPALRLNYPLPGFTWNAEVSGFCYPKPYSSWIINRDTGYWAPPGGYPLGDANVVWDDANQKFIPGPPQQPYVLSDAIKARMAELGIPMPPLAS